MLYHLFKSCVLMDPETLTEGWLGARGDCGDVTVLYT